MRVELRHRLTALFPDDRIAPRPCRTMTVHAARGAVAAVNVLCRDLPPGAELRTQVTCAGRQVGKVLWFRLVDVPVERNTDTRFGLEKEGRVNPHVIRRAPFRIYDAMAPATSPVRADVPTMALRLHVPVPADMRPGRRDCRITLTCGGDTQFLQLRIVAHRAVVPPLGPTSFPYTNWFDYEAIATRHGLRMWSPAYWNMLRRYAALMAHGRQSMFWLPLPVLFDGTALNIPRLCRLVRLFTDAGLHWIEGGHVAGSFRDGDYRTSLGDLPAGGIEGHAVLAGALRQLRAAVVAKGWEQRWLQHVADEPRGEMVAPYRILSSIVRKYMPGVPLIDAMMDKRLVGTADIWVIQNDEVREHLPYFQAQRRFGDQVWLYTCMGPGGNGLNRLMDMELIRCTILSWACVACGFDGYLHWGLNHCRKDQDPFRQPGYGDLPAGDTHIVYPGPCGPWSSVRLEAHREGMEDLELLRELLRRAPVACRRIVRQVVRDCWDYTKDVTVLEAARRRLLRALQ